MAISRIQNVSATANNVAISSTTNGDLIIVFAYFAGTATIPTLPGGFTSIVGTAGTQQAARLGYKISAGGDTTSGTWTNATQVVCHVYRGTYASASAIGATPTINAGNGTTLTYTAVTLQHTDGSSFIAGFGGASSATAGMNGSTSGTAPNLTNRTNQTKANGLDTGATASNLTSQTLAVTTTGRWQTVTVEIKAPLVFTQSYTPSFSPTAALNKRVNDGGFVATLSFAGNFAKGLLYLRNFAATLMQGGLNDGDSVVTWTDSVSANVGTPSGSVILKKGIIGGRSVVRLSNGWLQLATALSSNDGTWSCIAVMKAASSNANLLASLGMATTDTPGTLGDAMFGPYLFSSGGTGDGYVGNGEYWNFHAYDTSPHIYSCLCTSTTNVEIYVDGTRILTASDIGGGQPYLNLNAIGRRNLDFSTGDIAEIIFYDNTISSTDLHNVEKGVGDYYGITVASGSSVDPASVSGLAGRWKADSLAAGPLTTLAKLPRKSVTATLASTAALLKKITDAGFTATLSFVGALTKRMTLLRNSFTATLYGGASAGIGTQTVTDDFNRANENPLAGNWTNSAVGSFKIVSNAVTVTDVTGNDSEAFYNAWSGGNDQYSQAEITVSGGTPTEGAGVVVRRSTTAGTRTMYRLVLNGSGNWQLDKYITGSRTGLTSGNVTYVAGRKLGLSVQGTTLRVWYNGVQQGASSTDSGVSSGSPGLSTSTAFTSCSIDNWDAGTVGGISPAATLTRSVGKALSAGLSWIGNLAKSFIAGGGNVFTQSYAATLSFVGASTRTTSHLIAATLSFIGSITKAIMDAGFSATLSFVGAVAKRSTRFLSATLSFVGVQTASKSFLKALTATLSFVGAMSARIIATRAFTATLSFTGVSARRANKAFAATLNFIGALAKRITEAGFTATLSFVGALTKRAARAFAATLSFVGDIAEFFIHGGTAFTQSLTATLSFVGTFNARGIITRAFTATLNATATLSRSTGKAFAATLAFAASLGKRISRTFSGTASLSGLLVKIIRDAGFTATLSFVGNLAGVAAHFFTRAFTATLSFSGTLTRFRLVQRVFTATLSFSGVISRRIGKVLLASVVMTAATGRVIRKVLRGTLSFVGFLFRGGAVTVLAGLVTRCLATIGISGSTTLVCTSGVATYRRPARERC